MAIWALSRLLDDGQFEALRQRCVTGETDPDVLGEWQAPPPAERRLAG